MLFRTRMIAIILCLVMVLGLLPMGILAAEEAELNAINFMDPACEGEFTVANQRSARIIPGAGLYLVSTTDAFEPCNGQVSTFNPSDVVSVPVEGDWTATVKVSFAQGGSQGYYEFFGFYAAQGDDYQNLAGIRGGDDAMQDFLRQNGTLTADTDGLVTSAGLKSSSAHWFRIAKSGDDYTCYWSTDGKDFAELFTYADTGIEADSLILDAYSGMATGYNYTIEYLYYGEDAESANSYFDQYRLDGVVDEVIASIPESLEVNALDYAALPLGPSGCKVSYSTEDTRLNGNKLYATRDEASEITLKVKISVGVASVVHEAKVTLAAKGSGKTESSDAVPAVNYIGFMSDVHTAVSGSNGLSGWLDSMASRYVLDYVCFGGDYAWNDSLDNLNQVRTLVDQKVRNGSILGGAVYTMGNHECYENQGSKDEDYGPDMIQCGEGARQEDYSVFCFGAKENVNEGYFFPEDVAALDAYLASVPNDLPVFVLAHYALHEANGNDNSRTPVNSLEVIEVLNKYPNAIYIWGHNHSMNDNRYGRPFVAGDELYYSKTDFRDIYFTSASNGGGRDGAGQNINGMVAKVETYADRRDITFTYNSFNGNTVGSSTTISIPRYAKTPDVCAHNYEDNVVRPNCTAGGYTVKVCSECGDSYVCDETKALEHTYESVVTDPTCTKVGYTTHTCTRCGYVLIDTEVAALGHDYADGLCNMCGAKEPPKSVSYVLADGIEAGKTYVIVSDDAYALNNQAINHAGQDTLGATAVTVEDGVIVSEVGVDMLWTVKAAEGASAPVDGREQYFLYDQDGAQLVRRSGSSGTAPLSVGEPGKPNYATWSAAARGGDKEYTFYCNSYQDSDYPFTLSGSEGGFNAPGTQRASWDPTTYGSSVKFYEQIEVSSAPADIDFTDPSYSAMFEIVNPSTAEIKAGTGLTLVATRPAFEDCNGQNSGNQATNPEDVVKVPVYGDWTATLQMDFSTAGAANGYYQFFGFYAAEGDDFRNLAGIRGGDGDLQDFLRRNGTLTCETQAVEPGFADNGTYYLRITKVGTTYTCARSTDGLVFTDLFSYADTGMEADSIVIDAYTGMTEGYSFTLKRLSFGNEAPKPHEHAYEAVITDPTCTEKGYTTYTCACGESYTADETEATGHKWDEGVVTKEPNETENGVKTFTCTVCGATKTEIILPLDNPECPGAIFSDMPAEDHWAHKGIDYCVANKLMNGTGEGKFNPGGTLTRAELVTILYRMEGSPEVTYKGTFQDVKEGQWYTNAIEWAAANKIVNGVGDGTNFAPTGVITREQIATILFRYDGSKKVDGSLAAYPDAGKVSSFAADAMIWAIENKIITGANVNGVTYINPQNSATREQIASIMMRYLEAK